MLNSVHPFYSRRQALGLSVYDLQSHLSRQGFNYSLELLQAMERGERRFPTENPGFALAISQYLQMPVSNVQQTGHRFAQAMNSERAFSRRIAGLRPQNRLMLNFVLRNAWITKIPGSNWLFNTIQSLLLQFPDEWFER